GRAGTALRHGARYISTVIAGATDLSRHVDCAEAIAAGPRAASRDAIRRGVAAGEVLGKDARASPANSAHLSRPNAQLAVRCVGGANALAAGACHGVARAAQAARPAVVRIRL